jgi:hypothetical protein
MILAGECENYTFSTNIDTEYWSYYVKMPFKGLYCSTKDSTFFDPQAEFYCLSGLKILPGVGKNCRFPVSGGLRDIGRLS